MTTEKDIAETATGCPGSGEYRGWAAKNGYPHLDVYDWTSSAGDWTFIVSKDGKEWFVMNQENNWPRRGFTRTIDLSRSWFGTSEEVLNQIWEECQ